MRRLFYALAASLCATIAQATPDAAIHVDDQLLGANDSSFFVRRTVTYHPPTYYLHHVDTEVVTLSIWTGKVQYRCLAQRVTYGTDVNTGEKTQEHQRFAGCDVDAILTEQKVNPRRAIPAYVGPRNLSLVTKGIAVDGNHTDAPQLLFKNAHVTKLMNAMLKMPAGQLQPPALYPFSKGDLEYYAPSAPARPFGPCRVDPVPVEVHRSDWQFIHLICGSDSADDGGANVYLPVSGKTWNKVMQN